MIKKVLLLGATGSIGLQSIDLCAEKDSQFEIIGVSLKHRSGILESKLALLPNLKYVGIEDETKAQEFKKRHSEYEVFYGEKINIELINLKCFDKVINSLVGAAGFLPSLETIRNNMDLCLANKESLVIGGELIKKELKKSQSKIFPIDSEHVALAKLFKNSNRDEIEKVIITASGGSLRDIKKEDLKDVSIKQILTHPTWQMGNRITIDSATMVNKGFEFIEAKYLFDLDLDKIEVLVNDESQIHSALLFKDNSYLFEVGPSDMKIAISYALNEGRRIKADFKSICFNRKCSINFRRFDIERYPLFKIVLDTFKKGGTAMAFLNAVDEEVIKYLVEEKISYLEMEKIISSLVKEKMILIANPSEEDIITVDKRAREIVKTSLAYLE